MRAKATLLVLMASCLAACSGRARLTLAIDSASVRPMRSLDPEQPGKPDIYVVFQLVGRIHVDGLDVNEENCALFTELINTEDDTRVYRGSVHTVTEGLLELDFRVETDKDSTAPVVDIRNGRTMVKVVFSRQIRPGVPWEEVSSNWVDVSMHTLLMTDYFGANDKEEDGTSRKQR